MHAVLFKIWIIQYPTSPYLQRNLWKNKATEEKESKDEGEEKDVEEERWETHLKSTFTCIVSFQNLPLSISHGLQIVHCHMYPASFWNF